MTPGSLRKLTVFFALSLLAHALVIYDVPLPSPLLVTARPPLEARLQPAPALPPAITRPPRHIAAREPERESRPAAPPVMVSTAPQSTEAPLPVAVGLSATPAEETSSPSLPVEDIKPAPVFARRLPQKGEIAYELYLGSGKFNVGRTVQTWTVKDDRYRLTSVSQTAGLAAFFTRQSLEYVSTGTLTAGGLRPEFFGTERTRSGKSEAASARFDWSALTVTFGEPPRSSPLPANAQDIVSFMYQLGLLPLTPGRIELPITNGWKLERYELEIGIEEPLQTPFGALRAVPVRQLRQAGEESIELWLAPEYRWLPVRIRFFNRDGEPSGEQLVSDIRVSAD
jgi:hypothetical protein